MVHYCQRCECDLTDKALVFRVKTLNGYFCKECAIALSRILGVGLQSVINLPYYTT